MLDPTIERHIAKEPDGCWLWLAQHRGGDRKGHGGGRYGVMIYKGRNWLASRLVYTQERGPIPPGLTLDHLCRNTICVNPDHLEPVTVRENVLRGRSNSAINAHKTHCARGHEYAGDNLRQGRDQRYCRACWRINSAAYKARKRGQR